MCLQKNILKRFYETWPQVTFKEASDITGIQLTRIFRIVNGSPMKLWEYEAFKLALQKKEVGDSRVALYKVFEECLEDLPSGVMESVCEELRRRSKISKFQNVQTPHLAPVIHLRRRN